MEIRQRLEFRRLLIPELAQSLKILTLPLADLKQLVEQSLLDNPFLEEASLSDSLKKINAENFASGSRFSASEQTLPGLSLPQQTTLQDALLRQLGIFANTDEELKIGREIIGNLDENGYLKTSVEEISQRLNFAPEIVESCLKLVQHFDPPGVACRTLSECLLIQLDLTNEKDLTLRKIVAGYLEEVAKKNYSKIARDLCQLPEKIEQLIRRLHKLNPKPGSNYSQQEIQRVIPDVIIKETEEGFDIRVNDEDIPSLKISQDYTRMLKNKNLDPQAKEFLSKKLTLTQELQRAISKRKFTLRKIMEAVCEVQGPAIKNSLTSLLPLTYKVIAQKLKVHESTVCRAVMNKYVELPYCTVPLKDFFPSRVKDSFGQAVSSTHAKSLIKELIAQENKKQPLSDQQICLLLNQEENLKPSRRTVAKYRQELKILPASFRRIR